MRDIGQGEGGILIFAAQGDVEVLAPAHTWAAGGAFEICATISLQVCTISARRGGFGLPCVACLLPDKSGGAYARLGGREGAFALIRYPQALLPVADFEVEPYWAAAETFPGAEPQAISWPESE